jgi:hypothetical protein
MTKVGWVIYDHTRKSRYVPRIWPSLGIAQKELAVLLRHYPLDNEWRTRLTVETWPRPPRPKKKKKHGKKVSD